MVFCLNVETLDVRGKMCPLPVALTKHKLAEMPPEQLLEIVGAGELEFDNIQRWLNNNNYKIIEATKNNDEFKILVATKP